MSSHTWTWTLHLEFTHWATLMLDCCWSMISITFFQFLLSKDSRSIVKLFWQRHWMTDCDGLKLRLLIDSFSSVLQRCAVCGPSCVGMNHTFYPTLRTSWPEWRPKLKRPTRIGGRWRVPLKGQGVNLDYASMWKVLKLFHVVLHF